MEHRVNDESTKRTVFLLSFISGFCALVWFCIRVIPKPSRVRYPCQRAAFPIASAFVGYCVSIAGMALAFRVTGKLFRRRRVAVAAICCAAGVLGWLVFAIISSPNAVAKSNAVSFTPQEEPNFPMGSGRGIFPGRVAWVHDTTATSWDGNEGHWWDDGHTDVAVVKNMVSRSLQWLTGETSDTQAWSALFTHFNITHGRGDRGYTAGERITIKLNLNPSQGAGQWDNKPYPSPQVVHALVWHLVNKSGVDDADITVTDPSRYMGDPIVKRISAEFPDVVFVDRFGEEGRRKAVPDKSVAVHFSDESVSFSGETYTAACYTQAAYFINVAALRGHNLAGFTVCAKNHFGSLYREWEGAWHDGWSPSGPDSMLGLHGFIAPHDFDKSQSWGPNWKFAKRPMGSYNPLVDLMGHRHLNGKGLLFLVDGLYAAKHQSSGSVEKWTTPPFGTPQTPDWTNSILVSQDQVALESVVLDFLRSEPLYDDLLKGDVDNFLHEAALANDPPSGVFYDPEGDGTRLASLGVHEHWNNSTDKQYSRNLGTGQGIELVSSPPATVTAASLTRSAPATEPTVTVQSGNNGSVIFALNRTGRGSAVFSVFNVDGRLIQRWEGDEVCSTIHWRAGKRRNDNADGRYIAYLVDGDTQTATTFFVR